MLISKQKHNIWFKTIAIVIVCTLVIADIAWAAPDARRCAKNTLSPPLRVTRDDHKEQFALKAYKKYLVEEDAADEYIKGQIEHEIDVFVQQEGSLSKGEAKWRGERTRPLRISDPALKGKIDYRDYDLGDLDTVMLVSVTGILRNLGQFAHVGLRGRHYGMPVIYIDSRFFKDAENTIQRHDIDEIILWENLRRNILNIHIEGNDEEARALMRQWLIDHINDDIDSADPRLDGTEYAGWSSRRIAKHFDEISWPLDILYEQIDLDVDIDYDYINSLLTIYRFDEESADVHIAASQNSKRRKRTGKTYAEKRSKMRDKREKKHAPQVKQVKHPKAAKILSFLNRNSVLLIIAAIVLYLLIDHLYYLYWFNYNSPTPAYIGGKDLATYYWGPDVWFKHGLSPYSNDNWVTLWADGAFAFDHPNPATQGLVLNNVMDRNNTLGYVSSPFNLILFKIIRFIPFGLLLNMWPIICIVGFALIVGKVSHRLAKDNAIKNVKSTTVYAVLLLALFNWPVIASAMFFYQIDILYMSLVSMAIYYYAFRREKPHTPLIAGTAIAFATWIKVFPGILILYFVAKSLVHLVRHGWSSTIKKTYAKVAIWSTGVSIGLGVLCLLVFPPAMFLAWFYKLKTFTSLWLGATISPSFYEWTKMLTLSNTVPLIVFIIVPIAFLFIMFKTLRGAAIHNSTHETKRFLFTISFLLTLLPTIMWQWWHLYNVVLIIPMLVAYFTLTNRQSAKETKYIWVKWLGLLMLGISYLVLNYYPYNRWATHSGDIDFLPVFFINSGNLALQNRGNSVLLERYTDVGRWLGYPGTIFLFIALIIAFKWAILTKMLPKRLLGRHAEETSKATTASQNVNTGTSAAETKKQPSSRRKGNYIEGLIELLNNDITSEQTAKTRKELEGLSGFKRSTILTELRGLRALGLVRVISGSEPRYYLARCVTQDGINKLSEIEELTKAELSQDQLRALRPRVQGALGIVKNIVFTNKTFEENQKMAEHSALSTQDYHDFIEELLLGNSGFLRSTLVAMDIQNIEEALEFDTAEITYVSGGELTRIYNITLSSGQNKISFALVFGQHSCQEEMDKRNEKEKVGETSYKLKDEFKFLQRANRVLPDNVVKPYVYSEIGTQNISKYPACSMEFIGGHDSWYLIYTDGKRRVVSDTRASPKWQMIDENYKEFLKDIFKIRIKLYLELGESARVFLPAGDFMYPSQKDVKSVGPNYHFDKTDPFKTVPYDSTKPIKLTAAENSTKSSIGFLVRRFFRQEQVVNAKRMNFEEPLFYTLPNQEVANVLFQALSEIFPGEGKQKTIEWLEAYLDEYREDEYAARVSFVEDFIKTLATDQVNVDADLQPEPKGCPAELLNLFNNPSHKTILQKALGEEGVRVDDVFPLRGYTRETVLNEFNILVKLGMMELVPTAEVEGDKRYNYYRFVELIRIERFGKIKDIIEVVNNIESETSKRGETRPLWWASMTDAEISYTRSRVWGPCVDGFGIEKAVSLFDEVIPAKLEAGEVYKIRYNKTLFDEYQSRAGLDAKYSPRAILQEYVKMLRFRAKDPKQIKIIAYRRKDRAFISVTRYANKGATEPIGESSINIGEDIFDRPLHLVKLLNMAFIASQIPNDVTREELSEYDHFISYINSQHKAITGKNISSSNILQTIRHIVLSLPDAAPFPLQTLQEYYRRTIERLRYA